MDEWVEVAVIPGYHWPTNYDTGSWQKVKVVSRSGTHVTVDWHGILYTLDAANQSTGLFRPADPDTLPAILAVPKATRVRERDGETCNRCWAFCQYSEPNQPDGSFRCWGCRQ